MPEQETKYCQSCIERGYNSHNPATREWQPGIYYCEECFWAVIDNMTNVAPAAVAKHADILPKDIKAGPFLEALYQVLNIPVELQFDRQDVVNRNHDKIFNFHAPAIVNRTMESLVEEYEQLAVGLFQIQYKMETIDGRIAAQKEERRKEKNLIGYQDSREEYAKGDKPKKTTGKQANNEKIAKSMGMSVAEYEAMLVKGAELEKRKKEREFNIMVGNCATCGGKADVLLKEKGEDVPYCTEHAPVAVSK